MEEIGNFLPRIFKRQVHRGDPRLAEVLAPLWPRVAGHAVAEHSRPVRFGGGTLVLETDGDCWATQLQALSKEIQTQVNRFLGEPVIRQVRVRTAPTASEVRGKNSRERKRDLWQ
jgi:predicted nucleic acid-binding Zn ribbon protein